MRGDNADCLHPKVWPAWGTRFICCPAGGIGSMGVGTGVRNWSLPLCTGPKLKQPGPADAEILIHRGVHANLSVSGYCTCLYMYWVQYMPVLMERFLSYPALSLFYPSTLPRFSSPWQLLAGSAHVPMLKVQIKSQE